MRQAKQILSWLIAVLTVNVPILLPTHHHFSFLYNFIHLRLSANVLNPRPPHNQLQISFLFGIL